MNNNLTKAIDEIIAQATSKTTLNGSKIKNNYSTDSLQNALRNKKEANVFMSELSSAIKMANDHK
jgi:hypothetical protein